MENENIPLLDCPSNFMFGDASGKLMNEYGRFPCKLKCGLYAYFRRGTARATLNIESVTMREHDVLYIEPGSFLLIHAFSEDALVNYMVFSSSFLEKNTYGIHRSIKSMSGIPQVLHLKAEHVDVANSFFDLLTKAVNVKQPMMDEESMVHIYNLMQHTFNRMLDQRSNDTIQPQDRKMEIYRDYCQLVMKNYQQWHHIGHYAEAMHLTVPHLCSTIKAASDRTAGELINDAILMDAKAQLKISNLPIKEIALTLGFENVSFFNRFFKTNVGVTPKVYRNS